MDHFRKSKRLPTVDNQIKGEDEFSIFDTISDGAPTVEHTLVKTQIRDDVRELIQQLPAEQRQVLVMRHYADMSFKEISEQTNVSINTALGRMRYALINMRKLIDDNKMTMTY